MKSEIIEPEMLETRMKKPMTMFCRVDFRAPFLSDRDAVLTTLAGS